MITGIEGCLISCGNRISDSVVVNTKTQDDIKIISIKGVSNTPLDADFGAEIKFTITDTESFMADYRSDPFWCKPAFGNDLKNLPDETQGLIIKKTTGDFIVLLPLVSETYKCVFAGTENGITARLYSRYEGLTECNAPTFLYTEGENPFEMLEKMAKFGMKYLNNGCLVRKERKYPEIFEYLGWCSWDAMEIRVNHSDLLKKCEEFKAKNIPVKWVIIDDMWEEVHDFYGKTYETRNDMFNLMHSAKLYSFKADPKRFPDGLKKCIDDMNDYGIKVGLWHPTTGYWAGIDENGDLYKEHKDCFIRNKEDRIVCDYKYDRALKYYTAIHDYFKESGAEFVKIDNQSGINLEYFSRLAPVGTVAREYHNAIEKSVSEHFDGVMINCMGMASENMWNRKSSAVSRSSGDFLPNNSAWFTKHILMCAYNDLIQGQFYYCDFDMWWTSDGQAKKNSVLRAVSGGPVYVSDRLDESVSEIINPLILSDGKILRCDRPAMPARDCLTEDPKISGKNLKIQNICGDSGIVALFNVDKNNAQTIGTISPSDVEGLKGEKFAVYEHFSKECRIMDKNEFMTVSLKDNSIFKLYVIAPYINDFAVIGRTDKFISPKTVKCVQGKNVTLFEGGEYAVAENGKLKIIQ